jgi:hypothetical protein
MSNGIRRGIIPSIQFSIVFRDVNGRSRIGCETPILTGCETIGLEIV